ncbi:MAG: PTS sugar transporter subunit IIA [Anaerolineales bacterium]|nr:PTS sugar transporter subunit IIA [Anaerolineales bacterium]MDW8446871.1 PTS sugar transporter subunit IIA [Anaerolineales bacterium]
MSNGEDLHEISLREMLSPETVKSRRFVSSWEEAVEEAGTLLLAAGKIRAEYVGAMKRVLQEMGPYAVIAPGIVLLHARPEDGVVSPCIAIITLDKPVEFGHSENDPVDIVIAFGAIDKKAHVAALRALAEMLGDEHYLRRIRTAQTDSELYHALVGEG